MLRESAGGILKKNIAKFAVERGGGATPIHEGESARKCIKGTSSMWKTDIICKNTLLVNENRRLS
jgi:hypothetical protein